MLIQRGRTEQAQDSQAVRVEPTVLVDLADTALLEGAGEAVLLEVTTACPVGASGQQSYVNVSQGQALGNGLYVPIKRPDTRRWASAWCESADVARQRSGHA